MAKVTDSSVFLKTVFSFRFITLFSNEAASLLLSLSLSPEAASAAFPLYRFSEAASERSPALFKSETVFAILSFSSPYCRLTWQMWRVSSISSLPQRVRRVRPVMTLVRSVLVLRTIEETGMEKVSRNPQRASTRFFSKGRRVSFAMTQTMVWPL